MNDAEKSYSVGELYLITVVWGLEKFVLSVMENNVFIYRPPSTKTINETQPSIATVEPPASKMV